MNKILTFLTMVLAAGLCTKEPPISKMDYKLNPDTETFVIYPRESDIPLMISGVFSNCVPQEVTVTPSTSDVKVRVIPDGNSFKADIVTVRNFEKDIRLDFQFRLNEPALTESFSRTLQMARVSIEKDEDFPSIWIKANETTKTVNLKTNLPDAELKCEISNVRGGSGNVFEAKVQNGTVVISSLPGDETIEAVLTVKDVFTGHVKDRVDIIRSKEDPSLTVLPKITLRDNLLSGNNGIIFPNGSKDLRFSVESRSELQHYADKATCAVSTQGVKSDIQFISFSQLDGIYQAEGILTLTAGPDIVSNYVSATLSVPNEKGAGKKEILLQTARISASKKSIECTSVRTKVKITVERNFESGYDNQYMYGYMYDPTITQDNISDLIVDCDFGAYGEQGGPDRGVFMRTEFLSQNELLLTVHCNYHDDMRSGAIIIRDKGNRVSLRIPVKQYGWDNDIDKGLSAAELRARDSIAVRKFLIAMHEDETPFVLGIDGVSTNKDWLNPDIPLDKWTDGIYCGKYPGRVYMIRWMQNWDVDKPVELPEELGNLTYVRTIEIVANLKGKLPESMKNMRRLQDLRLRNGDSHYKRGDNGLEGSLDCEPYWSLAPHLNTIILGQNRFSGECPDWPRDMVHYTDVPDRMVYWFYRNRLEGKVPACMVNTPYWHTVSGDRSGCTYGEGNLEQQPGYILYE